MKSYYILLLLNINVNYYKFGDKYQVKLIKYTGRWFVHSRRIVH